jgi:predicted nucleic acid-binding protein
LIRFSGLIVIADAGSLIAFASIDLLSVLRTLFSSIYVTESIKEECLGKTGIDSLRIEAAVDEGWLVISPRVEGAMSLSPGLGVGESDSICFALETPEESLLIADDRLARRYALK